MDNAPWSVMGPDPKHVAIIMDGNGRWAYQRSLPRSEGHRQGVKAVRRTVRAALEMGIPYLTLFTFSTENWNRPADEINTLFALIRRFIRQDVADLHAAGVKITIIGERNSLEPDLVNMLTECENLTRNNSALNLIVAFNYSGRQELVRTFQRLADKVAAGRLEPGDIGERAIAAHLDLSDFPEPDLLIRTSGEQRLSNFLLWQMAYTEFVFIEEHWPDFDREIFARAIGQYQCRNRRYGGLDASAMNRDATGT